MKLIVQGVLVEVDSSATLEAVALLAKIAIQSRDHVYFTGMRKLDAAQTVTGAGLSEGASMGILPSCRHGSPYLPEEGYYACGWC
jgi:hypothetical protein